MAIPSAGRARSTTSAALDAVQILVLCLFAVVLVRNAWMADDAYITFRSSTNLIHGLGLTWNPAERVQGFTHPLWCLLVAAFYLVTGELYYTVIALSFCLSLVAVFVVARYLCRSSVAGVLALLMLASSKAFVDYSSSGLENPLTHLLVVCFLFLYLERELTPLTFLLLAAVAGLCTLNRMDTILLFLPPLVLAGIRLSAPWRVIARNALLGFAPFLIWELFSLVYFGFLFPNTAYAKLGSGIPRGELVEQGLYYFANSIDLDPLTLLLIVAMFAVTVVYRERRSVALATGAFVYLAYVVWVGGDFMSGRFLTAPLIVAVPLLCRWLSERASEARLMAAGAALLWIALSLPLNPLTSGGDYGVGRQDYRDHRSVIDERGSYYRSTGLLRANRGVEMPNHHWAAEGRQARLAGEEVVDRICTGFFAVAAGPRVHVVDRHGLTEPLLARLPARREPPWLMGHFDRIVPEGYLETLRTGENVIGDANLARFYDELRLITRAPLLDPKRLAAIWRMSTGQNAHLVDFDRYRHPGLVRAAAAAVSQPKPEGSAWDMPGNLVFGYDGLEVTLDHPVQMPAIELSLDNSDRHALHFYRAGKEVGSRRFLPRKVAAGGLAVYVLAVPASAVTAGYDSIRVMPDQGDNRFSLGHLRLLDAVPANASE